MQRSHLWPSCSMERVAVSIQLNSRVRYESTYTKDRWFRGRVTLIENHKTLIQHDEGGKPRIVSLYRLREEETIRRRFAGHPG